MTRSTDAIARRNALVESHLNLVDPIARALVLRLPPCFPFDDLVGAGMLGLIRAAQRFDRQRICPGEDGETLFCALARQAIRGAILNSIRRSQWYASQTVSLTPESITVPPNQEDLVLMRERKEILDRACAELSDAELAVIDRRYRCGEALASRQARRIHAQAIRRIRGVVHRGEPLAA